MHRIAAPGGVIVERLGDGLRVTRQTDHARLARDLAASFTDVPDPREAFLAAVAHHDDGWDAFDEAPTIDPATGFPHDYRNTPREAYCDVWGRGIERALARGPYVGLLVGLHGLSFLRPERGGIERAFHDAERARQNALLATTGFGGTWDDLPETPWRHRELLQLADALSLFVCEGWSSPWRDRATGAVADRGEDGVVRVSGAGLGARVVAAVPSARLARASYPEPGVLQAELAKAPREERAFTFVPM